MKRSKQTKPVRAFSYVRFSDRKQANGDSLRRQLKWGTDLCQKRGWDLDERSYIDLGVSAFRGKHRTTGALAAFREAIKSGKVKPGGILLIESLDRLSREDIDTAWELFRGILKSGVEIVTREPQTHYVPADLRNYGKRVEAEAFFVRAFNESETKSMRGREYWADQRQELRNGNRPRPIHKHCPAWLRLSKDKKRFEVIPESAKAVRLIYKWAGEGTGLDPITARLNAEGIPTIAAVLNKNGETIKRRRTDSWCRSYVAKLIRDKSVTGEFQPHVIQDGKRVPHGEAMPNYFPQIIPEKEWYAVRRAVVQRGVTRGRSGAGVPNLFTGVLRDARDGEVLHLLYGGRKGTSPVLVSYGCRLTKPSSKNAKRHHRQPETSYMTFPYDPIEQLFLQTCRELKASEILGEKTDDREDEIQGLSGKLEELDGKIAAVQQRLMDEPGIETLVSMLEKLDKERKATAAALDRVKADAAHQQPASALTEIKSIARVLYEAKAADRKLLRLKVRARVRQIVAELWLLPFDIDPMRVRGAEVQVVFHSGRVLAFLVLWVRRGRYRGLTEAISVELARPEKSGKATVTSLGMRVQGAGIADEWPQPIQPKAGQKFPLLSAYRTDPKVREFFARHFELLKPAILELVTSSGKAHEALAAAENLKHRRQLKSKRGATQ